MKGKMLRNILILIGIAVIIATPLYAWYVSVYNFSADGNIASSDSAYFAGGDGSEENPYLISTPRHLYNLAWLQDMGFFDDKDESTDAIDPYYFKLTENIDMSLLKKNSVQSAIPPIGIDGHPFISVFDGDGNTISNLKTDTNFTGSNCLRPNDDVLNAHVSSSDGKKDTIKQKDTYVIDTSYVGMFGIASKNALTSESTEDIKNFYIDTSVVTSTIAGYMGILAGYLNTSCKNIGVHNSTIQPKASGFSSADVVSKYTLVGDYNSNESGGIKWNTGTGDAGYGTSTSFKNIYDNLQKINPTDDGISLMGDCWAIPFKASNPTSAPSGGGTKSAPSGQYNQYETFNVAISQEATTKNMGYYTGLLSTSSITRTKIIKETAAVPSTFYVPPDYYPQSTYINNNGSDTSLPYIKDGEVIAKAPGDDVLNYLNTTYPDGSKNMDYSYQMSATSNVCYSARYGHNQNLLVENGTVGADYVSKDLTIPAGGIWFSPVENGTFKFVVATSSSNASLQFWKLKRNETGNYASFYTDLSTIIIFNGCLHSGYYYYFEIPFEMEDGYDYEIVAGDNGAPVRIYYMDIGAEGGGSETTYSGSISGVDFVYSTDEGLNVISDDTLSKVLFKLTIGDAYTVSSAVIIINRVNESDGPVVYYYIPTDGTLIATPSDSGNKRSTDSDPSG